MGTMTEIETHAARKQHRCDWCGQAINQGEQYRRYRYWNDGGAGTVKAHPECIDAMLDAAREEGGWVEWTPGSAERPVVAQV